MKKYVRTGIIAAMMGIYAAVCIETGSQISMDASEKKTIALFVTGTAVKSIIYTAAIFSLWTWGPMLLKKCRETARGAKFTAIVHKYDRKEIPFWGYAFMLLLMWLPCYLGIFPGAYAYDAPTQLEQFVNNRITSHHPVLHTLIVGFFLDKITSLTGSFNAGVAAYTITQMVFTALIFAYVLTFLQKKGVAALYRALALLFWGLSPVVQMFVTSSTKDIYFSGVFLLYIVELIDLGLSGKEFFASVRNKALFTLSACATMIMRNNGVYIVITSFVLLLLFNRREFRKMLMKPMLLTLILYFLYAGPFCRLLGVEKGGIQEMLSVPIQQMARTYIYHYNEMEPQDIELLEELIPKDALVNYIPTCADPVKMAFREDVFRENIRAYTSLWVRTGLKHFGVFVQSFLINTADFWDPFAVVDGYSQGTGKADFFYYLVGEPAVRVEMLDRVHEFYSNISQNPLVSKAPLMFLIMSPGWYLMMSVYMAMCVWNRGKGEYAVAYLLPLVAELTALLGPIAMVRYVLILYFAFPVLACMYFVKRK